MIRIFHLTTLRIIAKHTYFKVFSTFFTYKSFFSAMYEESDDNSACLGFLELKVLVNAGNCRDLMRLVSIYLQYGFDNEAFEDVLKNNRTVRELIER